MVLLSTVCPGTEASLAAVAGFKTGGAVGAGSSSTWVTASSPMPLTAAASTGNAPPALPNPARGFALPKFSGRYRPEVSAWLRPSSLASAAGSIAAISIGNCQLTLKPARPWRSRRCGSPAGCRHR